MIKKILFVILARKGSQRLKNKNILPLYRKPLICWTIEQALRLKDIAYKIIVSTDSEHIIGYGRKYKGLDFEGVTAAFFGCGDQVGYADNFLDAIGLLAKPFMENGGKLIGKWPTEDYDFDNSLALDGDDFLGLGLDNDNEEELTEERLIIWAELIKDEFEF